MAVTLTYTGSAAHFVMDAKIYSDRFKKYYVRERLVRNVAKTITGFSSAQLLASPEFMAVAGLSDITLTLTGADATEQTITESLVAAVTGTYDDVTFTTAMPFDGEIIKASMSTRAHIASSYVILRDAPATFATKDYGTGTALLRLTAKRPGNDGEAITFEIIDGGGPGVATCGVVGTAITVDLVGQTKTAAQIKTLIEATPAAAALVTVATPNGAGAGNVVVTALAALAGASGNELSLDISTATANKEVVGTKSGQTVTRGQILYVWRQDRAVTGDFSVTIRRTGY